MEIVVFLKQVPDNTKVKPEQIGSTLPTDGVPMMLNPFDEYALETALKLKEAIGEAATITAISLGQPTAKEILKKAIAVGADQAFLLSAPAFVNADSVVTAKALSAAVKTLVPHAQVLLFGQQSLDVAAGQTGPMVAELLGLPSFTFSKGMTLSGNTAEIIRESEQGKETHESPLPVVVCTMKCDYELRTSNIKGVMKANKTDIPLKGAADLGLDTAHTISPTRFVRVWQRPAKTGGVKIEGTDAQVAAQQLVDYLKTAKVL